MRNILTVSIIVCICADASTLASNCTEGTLRLVGGTNLAEGRVEICINNAWGTVCDYGFTKEDALVACRQLGKLQMEGVSLSLTWQTSMTDGHIYYNS